MPIFTPNYLQSTNIQDNIIRYDWDDWNEEQAEEQIDEELVSHLKGVSQRAVIAFMCGSAEWIVYRLAKLCDMSVPNDYMQAAWAMLVNVRYSGYGGVYWVDYKGHHWTGPVKRPIAKAFDRLEEAIQQLDWEGIDPLGQAVLQSSLVSYVMTDPLPYKRWCGQVMERMELLYPRDPDDELGDVVPRQAVDPGYDFKVEETESLINEFFAGLDYQANIFLSSPEEMLKVYDDEDKGFTGTPFLFDIEEDRKSRAGKGDGGIIF